MSAEDNTEPILGYGLESNFNPTDAPPALLFLLGEYKKEITFIKEKKLKADQKIKNKWETYASTDFLPLKSYTPGTKLLGTSWNQDSPYNNSCPLDPNTGNKCLVGCTAVALGQILNYWECKVFPDGTRTYYPNVYFTNPLTVNFYDQDYDWDDIRTVASATADFLYHCGVAIRVNYTDSATSGYSSYVEYAMENNFGFETSGLKSKNTYPSSTWINMLKADIDAGRPIYYDGTNTTVSPNTAHAWVIDGYKATNEFHCNWGWGGMYNDWYYLTDLTPGSHNYNSNQHAIIGAEPILDTCSGLSGSDHVCSSNVSYSVSIPTSASVEWSKSSNIDQVGGNTSTTYTVNEGSSGTGYVTATIKNSQGQTFLTRTKNDIYVSTPYINPNSIVFSNGEGGTGSFCTNCFGNEATFTVPCDFDQLDVKLTNLGETQTLSEFSVMGDAAGEVSVAMDVVGISTGTYMFWVRGINDCGTGGWTKKGVQYLSCGGLMLAITPNPTSGETTITVEETTAGEPLKSAVTEPVFDAGMEWELEVYSPTQNLKEKKTKIQTKGTTLQTQGWQAGVYMVRAIVKPEGEPEQVLTGKLVVKK